MALSSPRQIRAPQLSRAGPGSKMADTAPWEEEERGGVAQGPVWIGRGPLPAAVWPGSRHSSPDPGRVGLPLPLSLKNKIVSPLNLQVIHGQRLEVWKTMTKRVRNQALMHLVALTTF